MIKEANREIWRKGMFERVKKETVPLEHGGHIKSGNFKIMIGECTPPWVGKAVTKEMGTHKVCDFLYKELRKFDGKG